jgi:hypothetical protein
MIERTITAIGWPAERRVVHGDPAIKICRVAEEGRFNLVVGRARRSVRRARYVPARAILSAATAARIVEPGRPIGPFMRPL